MKALKTIFIALPILFILWIVGLFNGLKLTPDLHEDYYIGDHGLDQRMIFPAYGLDHQLTVNKLSTKVLTDGKALDTIHFYVYNAEGLQRDLRAFTNDTASAYVEARYVYDLSNLKKFTLDIDADYIYNDTLRQYKQSFEVVHTRKLRWHGLNLGGKH